MSPRLPDGVLLLGGAARGALGLARERVGDWALGRSTGVDPTWLTAALQASHPGARVRAVEVSRRTNGTTDRAALEVAYDDPGPREPPPGRLFVKRPPSGATTRVFINLCRLGASEVRFYREIAPSIPIEVPRCYLADVEGPAQRFVLLLEDLEARGARPLKVADRLDLAEAGLVVEALGRFHAAFHGSRRLDGELGWLRAPDRLDPAIGAFERALPAMALRTALGRHGDLVPDPVRRAGRRIVRSRRALERVWARGPHTVLHGDAHAGNLFRVDGRVGLLDWQLVQRGQGMRDVAYFMTTSLETDLRREAEEALIRRYLEVLADRGASRPPSFDEAWAQYRLHALYAWQATMFTAAAAGLQQASEALAGFERTSRALVDLRCVDALDGVPGA